MRNADNTKFFWSKRLKLRVIPRPVVYNWCL